MCGITGFWETQASSFDFQSILTKMTTHLQTRGPDDAGQWLCPESGVALGHRRLAVVDLSPAGHQPMVSACGRYVLVYNGEIYNAPELGDHIQRKTNKQFRGHSDTEVLLQGCALWGVKNCIQKIIGMFAFALFDRHLKTLTLVRDRLGIKPLYWGIKGSSLLFGSQPKSLRPHPQFDGTLNHEILATYLRYGYIPAPHSIYADIYQLEPGHLVTIDAHLSYQDEIYWAYEDHLQPTSRTVHPSDMIKDLEALLSDAVRRRMVADVPLGAFLSGGIDSSLVTALMQKQSLKPIKTFSIGFEEADHNEAVYAQAVANHLGTEHHELYLSAAKGADLVSDIPQWFDEPFADSSQIPTYLVSKMAKQHVTVALSGDGGDELFAGYNRYVQLQKFTAHWHKIPPFLRKIMGKSLLRASQKQWDCIIKILCAGKGPKFFGQGMHKFGHLLSQTSAEAMYQSLVSQNQRPTAYLKYPKDLNTLNAFKDAQYFESLIQYFVYMDIKTYLPYDILTKVDRASMAVGLEARVPFLDHRVVEYAQQIPLAQKIQQGQGKVPLRKILSQYVPSHLFERPKAGFSIPLHTWLKGPLRDWAESLLSKQALNDSNVFNPQAVQQLWQDFLHGKNEQVFGLWTFLMFQAWYAEYQKP